jgi:hypothetical protein
VSTPKSSISDIYLFPVGKAPGVTSDRRLGAIANNSKRLDRQCLASDEMRVRSFFFGIKAGGVGLLRKSEDQTNNSFSNRQTVNNVSLPTFDTFDCAKPRFLNRSKKRRSVSTLSPSAVLGALSLSEGIPRASDRGVEWVDFF